MVQIVKLLIMVMDLDRRTLKHFFFTLVVDHSKRRLSNSEIAEWFRYLHRCLETVGTLVQA